MPCRVVTFALLLLPLLVPSLAENRLAEIGSFTVNCKQKNGTHEPMANLTVVLAHLPDANSTATESRAIMRRDWTRVKRELTVDALAHFKTDESGKVAGNDSVSYPAEGALRLQMLIECSAELRRSCPGVDNLCAREFPDPAGPEAGRDPFGYLYSLDYDANRKDFASNKSVLLLRGDMRFYVARKDAKVAPMTEGEFCGRNFDKRQYFEVLVFERVGCSCSDCRQEPNIKKRNKQLFDNAPKALAAVNPAPVVAADPASGAASAGALLALVAAVATLLALH